MITGIILAAGFSRRMGEDKLLLKIDGESIIEKVIKASSRSNLDRIILVYRKDEVKEIGERYGLRTIHNENADLGQSQSMKVGIGESEESEAYMFIVGDQPFLTKELINILIEEYKKGQFPIVVPYFNGDRGMPMIMSSEYKEELLNVVGDKGGRKIVRDNLLKVKKVHIEDQSIVMDLDTPEDFEIISKINLRR